MHRLPVRLIFVATFACALGSHAAAAQPSADVDARTKAITHDVMSPFCPGLLLADCPSEKAFELREEIGARVARGETRESIEDDLAARFGEHIRTEPGFSGIGLLAWLGPPIAALIGLLVIVRQARLATAGGLAAQTAAGPAAPIDDRTEHRLQDELDELD
ncbi:MAG: cytochrome c-type biogenesis protein CcmH [Vicinamibacterales bacterium]